MKVLVGFVWIVACVWTLAMGVMVVGSGDPWVIAAFVTPILPWALSRLYRRIEARERARQEAEDEKRYGFDS